MKTLKGSHLMSEPCSPFSCKLSRFLPMCSCGSETERLRVVRDCREKFSQIQRSVPNNSVNGGEVRPANTYLFLSARGQSPCGRGPWASLASLPITIGKQGPGHDASPAPGEAPGVSGWSLLLQSLPSSLCDSSPHTATWRTEWMSPLCLSLTRPLLQAVWVACAQVKWSTAFPVPPSGGKSLLDWSCPLHV